MLLEKHKLHKTRGIKLIRIESFAFMGNKILDLFGGLVSIALAALCCSSGCNWCTTYCKLPHQCSLSCNTVQQVVHYLLHWCGSTTCCTVLQLGLHWCGSSAALCAAMCYIVPLLRIYLAGLNVLELEYVCVLIILLI